MIKELTEIRRRLGPIIQGGYTGPADTRELARILAQVIELLIKQNLR